MTSLVGTAKQTSQSAQEFGRAAADLQSAIATLREAVALVAGRCELEASGNMTLARIPEVAATGVDFISVGTLTHSAPALDFSLEITPR
jgi:nicotinate-nucleotide pyrophosphorylase